MSNDVAGERLPQHARVFRVCRTGGEHSSSSAAFGDRGGPTPTWRQAHHDHGNPTVVDPYGGTWQPVDATVRLVSRGGTSGVTTLSATGVTHKAVRAPRLPKTMPRTSHDVSCTSFGNTMPHAGLGVGRDWTQTTSACG